MCFFSHIFAMGKSLHMSQNVHQLVLISDFYVISSISNPSLDEMLAHCEVIPWH